MTSNRVIIIGAGIGGLVSAAILSHCGFEVVVLEKSNNIGGKIRQINIDGCMIDAGPTVFTMRALFEEIFMAAGTQLDHHLSILPLNTLARHFWGEDQQLDLFADKKQSADAISLFASAADSQNYLNFCQETEKMFNTLHKVFINAPRPSLFDLVRRIGFRNFYKLFYIKPFKKMYASLTSQFKDERLRQLFARYATYCGSSPYLSPATLLLIAHVEQSGVWTIEGGMHNLAKALYKISISNGAKFYLNHEINKIYLKYGRVNSVSCKTGDLFKSDVVISNADINAFINGLFGAEIQSSFVSIKNSKPSLSAVTWCLKSKEVNFPLIRHNVFFSDNYRKEFSDIFEHNQTTRKPTVYICAQDRKEDDSTINANSERLFCLINAPANGETHTYSQQEMNICTTQMGTTLKKCGLDLNLNHQNYVTTTPTDFANLFPATGGALYGQATHGWKASFLRSGSRCNIPGLYLAGGSVHPGAGIPMAATSALLAVQSLMTDQGLTKKSNPVGMLGGMLMR